MIITPALLTQLFVTFSAAFKEGFAQAPSYWQRVAMLAPSNSKSTTYGWLGQFPQFREWVGDRVLKDLAAHGYSLTNKDFESTVKVKRTEIEDDAVGVFGPIFTEMGRASGVFPDELTFAALLAGFATACYDGQYFFDTDHPVYPNVDGTGTAASVSNFGGGAGTPWFLLDTSRAIKPLILQERKKPVFTAMTKPDDEAVFMTNEYRYGVDCRYAAGYGLWQLAYGSKQTFNAANFEAAWDAMRAFKADGGRPMGLKPNVLVYPTSLRSAVEAVILKQNLASGESNTNYKRVELLEVEWLG